MGLRDQFSKLRNYFVDDDDDYDYEDSYEQPTATPEPAPAAAEKPKTPVQPAAMKTQSAPAAAPKPRPTVQSRPIQQPVQPSYTARHTTGLNATYSSSQPQPTVLARAAANNAGVTNLSTINIKEPHVYQDIMALADVVKQNQSVLINFKNMGDQQARRSIDFLTGVAYIENGDIQNIGGQIFLVTPSGVTIEGDKDLSMLAGSGAQNFENLDLTY